jgi:hypothetical protein
MAVKKYVKRFVQFSGILFIIIGIALIIIGYSRFFSRIFNISPFNLNLNFLGSNRIYFLIGGLMIPAGFFITIFSSIFIKISSVDQVSTITYEHNVYTKPPETPLEEKKEKTLICPYCGQVVKENEEYCSYCGEKLREIN